MIRIHEKIRSLDLSNKEIYEWLDDCFQGKLLFSDEHEPSFTTYYSYIEECGRRFIKNSPDDLKEFFMYTADFCSHFIYWNLAGRILYRYVFPEFFKKFPLGQIWLIEVDEKWAYTAWRAEQDAAKQCGMNVIRDGAPFSFSGLQEENLIHMSLDVMSYSLYPLFLCEYVSLGTNLSIIFIPDRAFSYSQMTEAQTLYTHLLWKFHHVFDDVWTFDSSRGPKSAANETSFNPINLLDYFEWYIDLIDKRLEALFKLKDESARQQRAMTLNSIVCDLFLNISSELPYLSKISFFSFLDKVSNYLVTICQDIRETDMWKRLLSSEFLSTDLIRVLNCVPGIMGEELKYNVDWVVKQLKLDGVDAELLRDLRNSQHGYLKNVGKWQSLIKHSGEVHNDISLLSLPFWIYILNEA